jgi:hypothetical protein
MTSHFGEEQLLEILHGTIDDGARAHLASCPDCSAALAREAALDQVVWAAVAAAPSPGKPAAPARPRRTAPILWIAAGTVGIATAIATGYASHGGRASSVGSSDMSFFAWQNVIFEIPILIGLLLIFGAFLGGAGHDAHHDVDHGHDSEHHGLLSLLGVGRVPLTVALMLAALLFGGIGMIGNGILSACGVPPSLYGPISLADAFVGMVLLTGPVARLIARALPSSESYPVSRHDFAGCTGTLLLPADATQGYAQVRDREGNVHNVRCKTTGVALAKGIKILVVEYDEASQTYTVDGIDDATAG